MRILDKYLIKEYLKTFVIIFFAFSVLFMVVEISDRLPRLLKQSADTEDIIFLFYSAFALSFCAYFSFYCFIKRTFLNEQFIPLQ